MNKVPVMKRFALRAVFLLGAIFLLQACASNEVTSEQSNSQSAAPVPGEKLPGEGIGAAAGPGGAGANVHW
jgi:hypothetical protein